MCADRPRFVVEVEDRRYCHHVHVGVEVGVECAYVAPVESFLLVLVDEVEGVDAVLIQQFGQDIVAEVVGRLGIFGILQQRRQQDVCVEQVHPHRSGAHVGIKW